MSVDSTLSSPPLPSQSPAATAGLPSIASPLRHPKNRTRDLTIFKKVVLENYTHQEVANVYNLDKSRVTQIIARVRRWLAQADQDDPNIQDPLAHHRLETQIEQMRLEFALSATTDALKRQPSSLSTVKQGTSDRGGTVNTWNVVTTRDVVPTAQLINAYLRVTRRIGELRDSQVKDHPIPVHLQQDDLLKAINEAVRNWLTASPKFTQQPSSQFLEAVKAFKMMLGKYLDHRRAGLRPSAAWPPRIFGVRPEEASSPAVYSPAGAATTTPIATAGTPSAALPPPQPPATPQELTKPHPIAPIAPQPLTMSPNPLQVPTSTPQMT